MLHFLSALGPRLRLRSAPASPPRSASVAGLASIRCPDPRPHLHPRCGTASFPAPAQVARPRLHGALRDVGVRTQGGTGAGADRGAGADARWRRGLERAGLRRAAPRRGPQLFRSWPGTMALRCLLLWGRGGCRPRGLAPLLMPGSGAGRSGRNSLPTVSPTGGF